MKLIGRFIRDTLLGGILFLVPIIVVVAVLGKAHVIARKIVGPLAAKLPFDSLAGLDAPIALAWVLIILFCLLAGLFSRTAVAQRFEDKLEGSVLSKIPGYTIMKGTVEGIAGRERAFAKQVVLARIEDSWQIGFMVERIEPDHFAVFVPGTPDPKSGSVYFMGADRIKPIDMPVTSALHLVKNAGKGSEAVLRGKL